MKYGRKIVKINRLRIGLLENYRELLEAQLNELNILLKKAEGRVLKDKKLPNMKVKVSKSNGCHQYHLVNPETNESSYVRKENYREIVPLVQREYDQKVYEAIKIQKDRLDRFLKIYKIDEIKNVYTKMPSAKQEFIIPLIQSDDEYIAKWLEEHPGMQNSYSMRDEYLTAKGELVRSKSEKIIADALFMHGIPYQYESPLELGHRIVYPDFVVLNLRKRKTVYWEHLGLVSDIEYAPKNFIKLQDYEKSGYLLGRDFIVTMESSKSSLDVKIIEEKIQEFLL